MDPNESRSREFVDFGPGLAVEVERDAITFLLRLAAVTQHRRIVASDFSTPSALWCGTVEVLEDQCCYGMYAVVDAGRHHVDEERVFFGWIETELSTGAKQEGPDVHARAGPVGWHEGGVQRDGEVHGFLEQLDGNFGHADVGSGMLHSLGVFLRAENANRLVVGSARCFESFVALHPVVESWGHAVEAEEGVGHEFGRCPLACLDRVAGFDVPVDLEAESVGWIVWNGEDVSYLRAP